MATRGSLASTAAMTTTQGGNMVQAHTCVFVFVIAMAFDDGRLMCTPHTTTRTHFIQAMVAQTPMGGTVGRSTRSGRVRGGE